MGGDYYDRDVGTSTTSNAQQALSQTSIHSSCNPTRWADDKLECIARNPIVFGLDVTGSMGEWTKIIYDKMPMFYGQIMMQKYLEDPSISFCAIGDHGGDEAPLQCTEFGRGNEIDQLISKVYLEGNGQGNGIEGYEMCAYFYDQRVDLSSHELPFLFITGDEGFYSELSDVKISSLVGVPPIQKKLHGKDILQSAAKKYNLFHIKKRYDGQNADSIHKQWEDAIGKERILKIKTPKACIDIILGAIALTSGKRTLDEYIKDLIERGQSTDRVAEVTEALSDFWHGLKSGSIKPVAYTIKKESHQDYAIFVKDAIESRSKHYADIALTRDQIQNKLKDQVPAEFICPITKKIMITAVCTSDGETFDKDAIELWFSQGSNINPITKETLDSLSLTKNNIINKMIDSFVAQNDN